MKSLSITAQLILSFCVVIQFIVIIILVHTKNRKTDSISKLKSFTSMQLDAIENRLLTLDSEQTVYDELELFIKKRFIPLFFAFAIPGKEHVFHLTNYSGSVKSRGLCFQLLKKHMSSIKTQDYKRYEQFGIVIPYKISQEDIAYILIGEFQVSQKQKKEIQKIASLVLPPLSRILSRAIATVKVRVEQDERKQLQYAFSRYISPEFVQKLIENPSMLHTGGNLQCLSVLFSDLQGFTTLSDSMDSKKLVKVLNLYLNEMSEVILTLGGTIDKFEGDAILAFFGAPVPFTDHAIRCCRAAYRMKKMEKIINDQLLSEKLITQPLFTRIGINSGDMIVGNIGSLKRLDYTIIGTNVNIASRIEEINKNYSTSILISEATKEMIGNEFEVKLIDEVLLRGVKKPIKLYEIIEDNNPGYQAK